MSELTRQRHEQRMAERRRGAGDQRVVTQAFGFDMPPIKATPPGVRAQKAAEAAKPVAEPIAPIVETLEPVTEEPHRRRSSRSSAGSPVVSVQGASPAGDGSAKKKRKLDSSPMGSVRSRRSTSAAAERTRNDANGQATPEIAVTEILMEKLTVEPVPRTPVTTRTTPRISSRRTSLAPEASLIMSSPSPLPLRNGLPITSSVSPEPAQFHPDPIIPEAIEEEHDETVEQIEPTPEPTPPRAVGLRNTRKKAPKAAIATTTPVPRGKRRRQPSPDKFLTPEKAAKPQPQSEDESAMEIQADLSVEQIARETAAISSPVRDAIEAQEQIAIESTKSAKPPGRRRGRPKAKKPSVEIPVDDLPGMDETTVLSDVEPDQTTVLDEMEVEAPEAEPTLDEIDNEADFEDEEVDESLQVIEPETSSRQRKSTANASRKPRQPSKSKRRSDNGEPRETFDITVHRIPKQGDFNFKFPKQPNNVQIVSEFILGIIDKQVETLSSKRGHENDREEKARLKVRETVVKNFSSALENRFIGMANKADNIKMKSAQLRRLQREKQQLRDDLMRVRENREEVARQMDSVRKRHEEASEKANKQQFINDTLKTLESVLEQGRAKAAAAPSEDQDGLDLVGLDALITSVTEDVCGAEGDGKGILGQIREMNKFLEASIASLQR